MGGVTSNLKAALANMDPLIGTKTREEKLEIIKDVFENRKKLIIDDYCIDQHCSQGRIMGKGKKDWKTIGSLVVDQDKEIDYKTRKIAEFNKNLANESSLKSIILLELKLADVFTSCLNVFINKPTFSKFVILLLFDSI